MIIVVTIIIISSSSTTTTTTAEKYLVNGVTAPEGRPQDLRGAQRNATGTQPTNHQHNRLDTTNTTPPRYDQDTANTWYQHGNRWDTTSQVPPRHHLDTMKAPPRHDQKSTTPCRHLPDAAERLPRHHRDTPETPPKHHRDTTETPRLPRRLPSRLPILIAIKTPPRHHGDTTELHKHTTKTPQKHHQDTTDTTKAKNTKGPPIPLRHHDGTTERPPTTKATRDASETPPKHHRDTSKTPPRHHWDITETPPRRYWKSLGPRHRPGWQPWTRQCPSAFRVNNPKLLEEFLSCRIVILNHRLAESSFILGAMLISFSFASHITTVLRTSPQCWEVPPTSRSRIMSTANASASTVRNDLAIQGPSDQVPPSWRKMPESESSFRCEDDQQCATPQLTA